MLDNYPPGAAKDPRAPYNEKEPKLIKVPVSIYVAYELDADLEMPENYDSDDLEKAVREQIYFPHEAVEFCNGMTCPPWDGYKICPDYSIEDLIIETPM